MKLKKFFLYAIVFLLACSCVTVILANRNLVKIYGGHVERVDPTQFKAFNQPFIISNINVLSPSGNEFLANRSVYIEDGKIAAIDEESILKDGYRVIDGNGKYLIPGLTDAHVHLFKSPNDLLLYVANGITQIRELIGDPEHLEWRDEINNGAAGPNMFIASPRIGSFSAMEGFFMSWTQGYVNLDNGQSAEAAVKEFHRQGYDAVKIYSQINDEAYNAVTKTAHHMNMKVVGHVPFAYTMKDIDDRQDSVAHLEEVMNALNREFGGYGPDNTEEFLQFVEQRSAAVARDLVKNDVAVSTTLWLVESFIRQKLELDDVLREIELEYQNPGISEWSEYTPRGLGWLPEVNRYRWPDDWDEARRVRSAVYWRAYAKACQIILKHLVENQVMIMTGTDANLPPTVPGFSLHDEFISLNKVGMTPAQILKASTSAPAKWLNKKAGKIATGYQANLLMLDKNPLQDISNTKSIHAVVVDGKLYGRATLDAMLDAVKQANDESRNVNIGQYVK